MSGNGNQFERLVRINRLSDALCWATWALRNVPYMVPYVYHRARGRKPILYDKAYQLYIDERLHSIDGYMGDGVTLSLASNCILSGYTPLWSKGYEDKAYLRRVSSWMDEGDWPFVGL